jgi:hypothetical protein
MNHHIVQRLSFLAITGIVAACGESPAPTEPAAAGVPALALSPSAAALPAVSNTWAARASVASFHLTGFAAGAAPNAGGQWIVYTFGGADPDNEGGSGFPIRAYNTVTNTWAVKATRVNVSIRLNGAARIGNLLYYSGGWTYNTPGGAWSNQLFAYDYAADRQVAKANMPKYTSDGITGVYKGTTLLVLPGTCSGEGWPFAGYCDKEPFHRLWRYNPAVNRWGTRRESPHYHRGGAGGVIGDKFYAVGGQDETGASVNTNVLDVYDPATDTWRTLAPMPISATPVQQCISTLPCVIATVLDGRLWVITRDRRMRVYDPATNHWTAKASVPAATQPQAVVRVPIGGRAYLFVVGTGTTPSQLYRP